MNDYYLQQYEFGSEDSLERHPQPFHYYESTRTASRHRNHSPRPASRHSSHHKSRQNSPERSSVRPNVPRGPKIDERSWLRQERSRIDCELAILRAKLSALEENKAKAKSESEKQRQMKQIKEAERKKQLATVEMSITRAKVEKEQGKEPRKELDSNRDGGKTKGARLEMMCCVQ